MACIENREELENYVLGTILNDTGCFGFVDGNTISLKKDLFLNKQNRFTLGVVMQMRDSGINSFCPSDVFDYCNKNSIEYGNAIKFLEYMTHLSTYYFDPEGFKNNLKNLVKQYIHDKRYNGTR